VRISNGPLDLREVWSFGPRRRLSQRLNDSLEVIEPGMDPGAAVGWQEVCGMLMRTASTPFLISAQSLGTKTRKPLQARMSIGG